MVRALNKMMKVGMPERVRMSDSSNQLPAEGWMLIPNLIYSTKPHYALKCDSYGRRQSYRLQVSGLHCEIKSNAVYVFLPAETDFVMGVYHLTDGLLTFRRTSFVTRLDYFNRILVQY